MKNSEICKYNSIQGLKKGSTEYLLLKANYKFRENNQKITFYLDVGSTILIHGGKHFEPCSESSGGVKGDLTQHSERRSLAKAIAEAIKKDWGPFQNKNIPPITSDSLSIEDIEKHPGLLEALKELDAIHIFSERKSCNYSNNRGCAPYLDELNTILENNKINLYSHLENNLITNDVAAPIIEKAFYKMYLFLKAEELIFALDNAQKEIEPLENKSSDFSDNDASITTTQIGEFLRINKEIGGLYSYIAKNSSNLGKPDDNYDEMMTDALRKTNEKITVLDEHIKLFQIIQQNNQQSLKLQFDNKFNTLLSKLNKAQQKINDFSDLLNNNSFPLTDQSKSLKEGFSLLPKLEQDIQQIKNERKELRDFLEENETKLNLPGSNIISIKNIDQKINIQTNKYTLKIRKTNKFLY